MNTHEKLKRIALLKKRAGNHSPKLGARLLASIAATEIDQLYRSLPGSVRRGLERGSLQLPEP